MDLEHKSQSKAWRCERRGETRGERENKHVVVRDIPPETVHNDSSLHSKDNSSCLECAVQRFVLSCFPSVTQPVRLSVSTSVCPV